MTVSTRHAALVRQVRATNLQELVYKNGQAGITKATVSIKFDNTDKAESPLGYEQYDEITITRQVRRRMGKPGHRPCGSTCGSESETHFLELIMLGLLACRTWI